jgi:hypothetical protein
MEEMGMNCITQRSLVWARGLALCHRAEGISIRSISISLFAGLALLFTSGARVNGQQPSTTPGSVKHVLGFEDIKHNANGDLTVQADKLQFKAGKAKAEVSIPSVQDVFSEQDFKETIGGTTGTLARMAVPYGGGRVLSLLREKIDVLTVEYRDGNGGLHAAIFTLPQGQAQLLKRQLVAAGAHTSIPSEEPATPEDKKQ